MQNYQPQYQPKNQGQKKQTSSLIWTVIKYLLGVLLIFALVYGLINFRSLYQKFSYWWRCEFKNEYCGADLPTVKNKLNMKNNYLYIYRTGTAVPIVWNIDESQILPQLKNGVAHYKNSALPGNEGNVFITGHSSYYFWSPGKYNSVFALLDKVRVSDEIIVTYQNKIYQYRAYHSVVVSPTQTDIIKSGTGKNLYLVTCVPVGTNLRRLIIQAKQVGVFPLK